MRRSWVSSVVAGLLVLAPIAAVAQNAGSEAETVEEVVTSETQGEEVGTLEQVETTDTVDQEEATDTVGDGDPVEQEETTDTVGQDETTDTVEDGPAGESNDHGERVSTVARCAPTGKLDIEGFRNHGAFVRAVAHGETVTVEGVTYDLSTQEGVDALCAWADSYEPPAGETTEPETTDAGGAGAEERSGPPAHAGRPDHAGGPDRTGAASRGGGKGKKGS